MSTGLIILTASPLNALGDFSIPEGWLLCDGRTYDKNEYLNLYLHLLKYGPNSTFDSINNLYYTEEMLIHLRFLI